MLAPTAIELRLRGTALNVLTADQITYLARRGVRSWSGPIACKRQIAYSEFEGELHNAQKPARSNELSRR